MTCRKCRYRRPVSRRSSGVRVVACSTSSRSPAETSCAASRARTGRTRGSHPTISRLTWLPGGSVPSVLNRNYEAGGNIGGPIMRDRLWFFGSYHRQEQERSQSDFPEPIGVSQWQSTIKLDGQISPGNRVGVFYPTSGMVYTAGKYQLEALVADLRRQLGERFDLRAFHDRFMAAGPVPIAAHRLGFDRGRQGIAEGTRRARRSRSAAQPSSAGR